MAAFWTLMIIRRSAAAAEKAAEVAQQQIEDAREAFRLDQRAWLGYESYVILARANSTSGWERREPDVGEQFSGLFSIQNVGKTPALNVRFLSATPIVNTVGEVPDDEPKWSQPQIDETNVVFPSDEDLIQRVGIHYEGMSEQEFLEYSNRSKQIFFWARLYYCDVIGRRHWTQIGAVRLFDPDRASGFRIAASSVSPDPGEPNHEDCQNLGTPNP